jgi:UDP-glucose 6-dehydrogenase
VLLAVGTPSRRGDGHADLSYVLAAAREIAENLEGFTAVITKSTVPVGTDEISLGIVLRALDVVVGAAAAFRLHNSDLLGRPEQHQH